MNCNRGSEQRMPAWTVHDREFFAKNAFQNIEGAAPNPLSSPSDHEVVIS